MDGNFPALLQESSDQIIGILTGNLRECIATGLTVFQWKKVKVVFIPKPGKKGYSDATYFKPISLSSFFMKTLERMVDRYIKKGLLRDFPIHREQHDY